MVSDDWERYRFAEPPRKSLRSRPVVTDRPPRRKTLLAEFEKSDALNTLALPKDDRLTELAGIIEQALTAEDSKALRTASAQFLATAAKFYGVPVPDIRVLAARPIHVWESGGGHIELFGDYDIEKAVIRVWMRTAVQKRPTSSGTFLSTLCHEFCHHLDFNQYGFHDSPHTRGFYERAAVLYHHARGTPVKKLFWLPMPGERWRIDWVQIRHGSV
jgi:hypothetical protein